MLERTPLHIASRYGANKNAKNKYGKIPYDVACDVIKTDNSQRNIIIELLK